MNTTIKWKSSCSIILFLVITVSILYFSWIPDPSLTSESYLPVWLRDWSNSFFNLRTAIPFVAFGFLLDALDSKRSKDKKRKIKFDVWFKNGCTATFVVCLAEGGQFFILNRHPDIMDVLFGVLGSQVGSVIFYILRGLKSDSSTKQ
jgi:glycopeptide antibiotics resistance protein